MLRHCFSITSLEKQYVSLGCWGDAKKRAIDGYEGFLGVQGCYERAISKGFEVFGVQFGGQCFTSATAKYTYNKYGHSNECQRDGRGGIWTNEIYKIGIYAYIRFE